MILDDFTLALITRAEQRLRIRLRDWQARAVDRLAKDRDLFVRAGCGSRKTAVMLAITAAKEGNGLVLILAPLKALIQDSVCSEIRLV